MKKQYMIPEIQVVKIQPYVLQSGSPDVGVDKNGGVAPGGVESRGFFDFGDDEEEE